MITALEKTVHYCEAMFDHVSKLGSRLLPLPATPTFPLEGRLDVLVLFSPFSLDVVRLLAPSMAGPPTLEMENPSLRKAVLVTSSTKRFLSVSSDSINPYAS